MRDSGSTVEIRLKRIASYNYARMVHMVWFAHDLKQRRAGANNSLYGTVMVKVTTTSNTKKPALTLSVEHLVSLDDVKLVLFEGDSVLQAKAFARGHELTSRTNWADFGVLVKTKMYTNKDGNSFLEITNSNGATSSMKLNPKTNNYGNIVGKDNWELAYHLADTLTEYKLAGADLEVLISAHGKWATKDYFDLVQVIV